MRNTRPFFPAEDVRPIHGIIDCLPPRDGDRPAWNSRNGILFLVAIVAAAILLALLA